MKSVKVFVLSLIALVFVLMGIFIDWIFIAIAVIIMIFNQRELFKKKNKTTN